MLVASIPAKFPIPWGNSAGGSFIRPIPVTSQIGIVNGAASLTDGFPPLNFLAVASGGVPPFGQDANGILNQITAWVRWYTAGGPIAYDPAFQTSVGGYPLGAIVRSATTAGLFWFSTVDGNTTNPDTGGAGWVVLQASAGTYRGARIITANTTQTLLASDAVVGFKRASPLAQVVNLPTTGLLPGQRIEIQDLSGNFSLGIVTVTPPATHTISGLTTFVMNVDRQAAEFQYYSGTDWGVSA